MAETKSNGEKPFWQKNKVLYTLFVVVLVVGSLLALALTGHIEVSSEQIIGFGEWLIAILVGGHSLQRGLGYLGLGLAGRHSPPVATEPEPESPKADDEPAEEEDES